MRLINTLLRNSNESKDEYFSRFQLLTSLTPKFADVAEFEGINELLSEAVEGIADPADREQARASLIHASENGLIERNLKGIFQLGILMMLNPIQLSRYVEGVKSMQELEAVAGIASTEESKIDKLFEITLDQLIRKAELADQILAELEAEGVENPFKSDRLAGLKVYSQDLMAVRTTQKQLIETKVAALRNRDRFQETLSRVVEFENRKRS